MENKQPTPYKSVMTALRNGHSDKIPFTVYERKIPQCTTERELRNRGLCVVKRIASYKVHYPNVKIESYSFTDGQGRNMTKTVYSTPYGQISKLDQPAGFTTWHHEKIFKTPEDYKSLLFMIRDSVIEPDYAAVVRTVKSLGEDFVVRDQLSPEPMQNLILNYMGTEVFCYEWMDNRDEILKLYDALNDLARKIYPVVADGPLEFANYGGNVVPQIIGRKNFQKFFVPCYNEAAEILHKRGKLIGCHFDADNSTIMDLIAGTDLDYIEAYDPGMSPSVSEARRIFKNKVLWINWPSSYHLNTAEEVTAITVKLIKEAEPCHGFIIGITEDVPEERWQTNFKAIMNGIEMYG